MKIRMLKSAAGANFHAGKGKEIELPASIARGLLRAKFAELIEDDTVKPIQIQRDTTEVQAENGRDKRTPKPRRRKGASKD